MPLLGAAMVAAMVIQSWRALRLEIAAREVEFDRSAAAAARILRAASGSDTVLERLPEECRFEVRGGRVVVDDAVGWLDDERSEDVDPVVADRLARAARCEFAQGDAASATREYANLLAASLPSDQRLVVIVAASWFDLRQGRSRDFAAKLQEIDEGMRSLEPRHLAGPSLARAVAAAARLPREGASPAWVGRLVPALPPLVAAGLPGTVAPPRLVEAVASRRRLLADVDRYWRAAAPSPPVVMYARDATELSWAIPDGDGAWRGASVPTAQWIAAVIDAGRAGELAEWPWLVEPVIASEAGAEFAGVPHLTGFSPHTGSTMHDWAWLLPATTIVLLAAFGAAAWMHVRATRRESDAVRAQAEFLTTVTHELRTPLASIRLLGEMLAEGRVAGREREYYAMLIGESARLSMLIENVLDLGRLERGERAYDRRPVEVAGIVQETLALFAPLAEREGVGIDWKDGLGAPTVVSVDRGAFVQALVCVLDNALKYGASGGVIAVAATRSAGVVSVAVRDRGPGVPADERERVFQRFVRGAAYAYGGLPGLGIGLHLARTIVRRMGGDLRCEEAGDGAPGAVFVFTFPIEESE
ncbi:MAG: HAMP domain-containing histidine kinase [Planctomycetes bacterium]|nr:HAMP domain-containing histidine kinase [Planctomycetota bacterium]